MLNYILKRLLLIIPTLFGIMLLNFLIIQFAPGGPVEKIISEISGHKTGASVKGIGESGGEIKGGIDHTKSNITTSSNSLSSGYAGSKGLDPEVIAEIEKMYGFDKPLHKRFFGMLWDFIHFDFGTSFFKDKSVTELVIERLPISISLGLWSTLIIYLISIPLGIKKAIRDGGYFDIGTSTIITIFYAIPAFLFAVILIILFASGEFLQIFPLRGLTSDNFSELTVWQKITDYFHHISLPVLALVIGGFASLTMLTKNSFLDEIGKQYVITARAKGLSEDKVLYKHIFRNAMLIIIADLPDAFLKILFTGALLIEVIFSLNGLGMLGFEAVLDRDYPVLFGTLYFFTLIGLLINLLRDIIYHLIDPRIDFENRSI